MYWIPDEVVMSQRVMYISIANHTAHQHCAVCVGKVYAVGGYNGTDRLCSVEMFDPQLGKWSNVPDMICKRRFVELTCVDCCPNISSSNRGDCCVVC